MVLVYHSTQIFANEWPMIWQFTRVGFFGVDLFFALSGYLIGSLFFKEKIKTGKVCISRFILRRISRTVPPYFIVLGLSYIAVYLYRNEAFDFGYFVFAQNYYLEIPFFFISWSLCVEEHFYLLLPVMLTLLFGLFKKPNLLFVVILFAMSLIPLSLRVMYQEIDPKPFGFYHTATHLRFDPLILGVMYAYISAYMKTALIRILKYKHAIYILAVLLLLSYSLWPVQWMYSVGAYIIGFSFATAVAVCCEDKCWSISRITLVPITAKISYAIYLTHVLSTHVLVKLFEWLELETVALKFYLIIIMAGIVGFLFYKLIEEPIMNWRKKAIPSYRRTRQEADYANTSH